jgi:FAD/FMN-containing dehydrogenase
MSIEEIQTALPLLVSSNVSFAIRSGGHSPHHGFANIDNGVLIDMSRLSAIKYEAEKSTVTVGVGLKWGDLYTYLEQYHVTVVGGRIMDVGVGGLNLGGRFFFIYD